MEELRVSALGGMEGGGTAIAAELSRGVVGMFWC